MFHYSIQYKYLLKIYSIFSSKNSCDRNSNNKSPHGMLEVCHPSKFRQTHMLRSWWFMARQVRRYQQPEIRLHLGHGQQGLQKQVTSNFKFGYMLFEPTSSRHLSQLTNRNIYSVLAFRECCSHGFVLFRVFMMWWDIRIY